MNVSAANLIIMLALAVRVAESEVHAHHETIEQLFECPSCAEFLDTV